MIKEKFNKAVEYVKDHKKEFAIAAISVVGVIVAGKYATKLIDSQKAVDLPRPEDWELGWIKEYYEKDGVVCTAFDMPTAEIGKLGDNLVKLNIPEQYKYTNILVACVDRKVDEL